MIDCLLNVPTFDVPATKYNERMVFSGKASLITNFCYINMDNAPKRRMIYQIYQCLMPRPLNIMSVLFSVAKRRAVELFIQPIRD